MKLLKNISFSLVILIMISSFYQCSSAQKLKENALLDFGDVYCQKWASGIKKGGSGLDLFIPVTKSNKEIQLDSVYFRGKVTKLELSQDSLYYVGRFKKKDKKSYDIIMSSDPREEYGNKAPQLPKKIPFELKQSECVIMYLNNNKAKYVKIGNIKTKSEIQFPSAQRQ